jgi:hypothetical protein
VATVLTGVFVGVGVSAGGGVGDDVAVDVGEGPVVGVGEDVAVGVSVGVLVGVGEGPVVGVLLGVGPEVKVRTSWGGEAPSREEKETPSVLSARRTKS